MNKLLPKIVIDDIKRWVDRAERLMPRARLDRGLKVITLTEDNPKHSDLPNLLTHVHGAPQLVRGLLDHIEALEEEKAQMMKPITVGA